MQRRINSWSNAVLVCSLLAAVLVGESSPLTEAQAAATADQAQSVATLSGVVTDTFGARLSGATISLYSADRVLQTKSDVKGQFRFPHVPPGTYQLEATRRGFKTKKTAAIRVLDSNEPLAISLDVAAAGYCAGEDSVAYADTTAGRELTGVVLDSKQPVAGAEVDLVSASGTRVLATKRSNGKGEFLFANLEPGLYSLRVSHPGYRDGRTEEFWIAREDTTRVEIEITKDGLLRVCQ
jgi:hypothetical protein